MAAVEDVELRVEQRAGAQDDRRHQRDLERLEDVRGHPRAVPDVVADVVGDRRRVPGVVLGDPHLDLAHEVGPNVGHLGVDAAADPHERGDEGPPEPEADQDPERVSAEEHEDRRGAQESEAHREHPGDGPGLEGCFQRVLEAAGRREGRADVSSDGKGHPDVPGPETGQAPEQEGQGHADGEARIRVDRAVEEIERDRDHQDEERHGEELAPQVGLGALLDRRGDLLHRRRSRALAEDTANQPPSVGERADGGGEHEPEERGLEPAELWEGDARFAHPDAPFDGGMTSLM